MGGRPWSLNPKQQGSRPCQKHSGRAPVEGPKFTARLRCRTVRAILWAGLAGFMLQWALFLRLTFWELSWDVMEPVRMCLSQSRQASCTVV